MQLDYVNVTSMMFIFAHLFFVTLSFSEKKADSPFWCQLDIYIADSGNHRIRVVTASSGIINTVAGNGEYGYSGDGGLATSAQLYVPTGIAVDASGNIYFADTVNHRIRMVINTGSNGMISTVAGNGASGCSSDGVLATSARLNSPFGVAVDASGNIYNADIHNNRIRMVTNPGSSGMISTVAGDGTGGFSGDGELAISAQLSDSIAIAFERSGCVYCADTTSLVIRASVNAT